MKIWTLPKPLLPLILLCLTNNALSSEGCDAVKDFAKRIAVVMQGGMSSDEVMDELGGIDSMSIVEHQTMSYVFSFKYNRDISPARIAGLAHKKCMAGGIGT